MILIVLFAVWLAFVAMPSRKEVVEKVPLAESPLALKLRAVGLPDNSDLGGLPEIFAIWADKAEWKDRKTKFAYWHPEMKTYSYFFQAVRSEAGVRFKEISEPQDPDYGWDDSLSDDCPIHFYVSRQETATHGEPLFPIPTSVYTGPEKVRIDVPASKILAPQSPTSINSRTHH